MASKRRMRASTTEIRQAARELRRDPTLAECVLWNAVRQNQLAGLRFRRPHAVDRFVLDFFCPSHRLVIEVDGDVHLEQVERDAARTAALEARGLRVIRFRNDEILTDLSAVLQKIAAAAGAAN